MLLVILSVVSLNTMGNKQNRMGLRLLERQRLAREISLDRDAMVRQQRLEKERREQTILSYDDVEYSTVMQPVNAEKFRKIIGQCNNQTVSSDDDALEYSTVMLPVDVEKFRKIIGQ